MKNILQPIDLTCVNKVFFKKMDSEEVKLDKVSSNKRIIKKVFLKNYEMLYNNNLSEISSIEIIKKDLIEKGYSNPEVMSKKIYFLIKKDLIQSKMYDRVVFNHTFNINIDDSNVIKIKIDKFEKNTEKNIYRITNYCNSISFAEEEIYIIASLLYKYYNLRIESINVKSLSKSSEEFYSKGRRTDCAFQIEEPDYKLNSTFLNMDTTAKCKSLEDLIRYCNDKNNNVLEQINLIIQNQEQAISEEINECKYCKYNKYCIKISD